MGVVLETLLTRLTRPEEREILVEALGPVMGVILACFASLGMGGEVLVDTCF